MKGRGIGVLGQSSCSLGCKTIGGIRGIADVGTQTVACWHVVVCSWPTMNLYISVADIIYVALCGIEYSSLRRYLQEPSDIIVSIFFPFFLTSCSLEFRPKRRSAYDQMLRSADQVGGSDRYALRGDLPFRARLGVPSFRVPLGAGNFDRVSHRCDIIARCGNWQTSDRE